MAKGTPIWDHVGKPLTPEQLVEIQNRGEEVTPESIELQSMSIMKVADEIGEGSLIAFQQLAAMHDRLDELDYQSHIIDYIDEWDDVVTTQGDEAIKNLLELTKKRNHYVRKVDNLRKKVNKIEHKGVRDAPVHLTEKLERNEDKLEKTNDLYEDRANDVAVMLNESVRREWVDLYPLIKNAMKFEVNRFGRESSTFGRLTGTLNGLKRDYKEAIKGTDDALRN
jgi:hemerythrin-like domain-containing protein